VSLLSQSLLAGLGLGIVVVVVVVVVVGVVVGVGVWVVVVVGVVVGVGVWVVVVVGVGVGVGVGVVVVVVVVVGGFFAVICAKTLRHDTDAFRASARDRLPSALPPSDVFRFLFRASVYTARLTHPHKRVRAARLHAAHGWDRNFVAVAMSQKVDNFTAASSGQIHAMVRHNSVKKKLPNTMAAPKAAHASKSIASILFPRSGDCKGVGIHFGSNLESPPHVLMTVCNVFRRDDLC
jgi:hypothetical protein